MKKIFSIILFLVVSASVFGQFPNNPTQGGAKINNVFDGGITSKTGYGFFSSFPDTATANLAVNGVFIKNIPYFVISVGDDIYKRNSTATKWIKIKTTVTPYRVDGVDSIYFNIDGITYAVKDSIGSGGGSSSNVDSTIRLPITFTTPSIIQGTSHFAGTIPGANYAPVKLASDILGFTVVNQAVSGSSLMSIMETTYRGHQQFRRDSARFVESGWNDANNDYNANTAMRYYNVMKSTVTDQFLDTAIAANSASLSKVGTWSTYNTYTNAYGKAPFLTGGAGLGQTTSTVSDSIIWVTPTSTSVVVQGIGDYSTNLGSYTIWVDGVLKDTVNCQNQTTDISSAFDPFAVTKVPLVKVYDNLSNTTHTVVIKNISGTIIIDYVGTLRPNWEDQQPIYLHSTLRSQAKGFSQQIIGGGNSVIEEMNKMGRQVVKEFKALNPNNKVFFIDINKSVDYDKDFYTDGVHLTSLGTKKQANDIVNFITSPLSKYNAIDIPYLNYVATNDYPPLAGIQLQQPTATGQDNIGTIRMGNDIFLRWYAGNIGLGKGAWNSNSTAINSIAIGDGSQGTGLQTVGYNYTLGGQAGLSLTSGTKNFFGNFQTGLAANSASDNNIIGFRAFVNATDATDNNGFGTQGLLTNVHGSRNTFFGTNSLVFNEGSDNFTGGYFSGFNALTTDGSIYIGNRTAYNATAADYSIAIGTGVDLPSATTAGQLNIGNLIYGNNLYQSLTPSSTPVTGGKIGIGNSSPDSTLDVAGSIKVTGGARFSGLATGPAAKRVMADANGTLYLSDSLTGGGSGEVNTASNLGGGLANYDSKSGVDLRFNSFAAADFDLASNVINIDAGLKTDWQTAYTDRLKWDGGATGLTASTGRTSLGGTTIGQNIFTSTNPSAITFLRGNADNSVDWLSASAFRTAIGAGDGTNIYIADGTLTANRTVSGNGNNLIFSGGSGSPYFNVEYNKIILTSLNSGITIQGDSLLFDSEDGKYYIKNMPVGANSDSAFTLNRSTNKMEYSKINGSGGSSGTVNSGNQYRLAYYATTGTAVSEAAAITASRTLVSDANGVPTHATTTATEIGYVNGVTSAIQTQLNGKQPIITFGTGVETALGVNIGSAGAFITFNGAGGTPSSLTGTNITGTATGLTAGAVNNALSISAELISGGATTYNGSAAKSIAIQNASVTNAMLANGAVANLSGTNTGDQNLFSSIPVSGQTTITANSATTALTFVAGSNMTITTNNTTKEITFAATGAGLSSTNFVFNEKFTGSTSAALTLANTPVAGKLQLFKNGVMLEETTDYVEILGVITLIVARLSSDVFIVNYIK